MSGASEVAARLRSAPLELIGRFADASNATLLVRLTDRDPRDLDALAADLGHEPGLDDLDPRDLAVYKPQRGEAPLWDFPTGTLHRREVAASVVSDALGWGLVPTTVRREDAPFGVGSLQRYVTHDPGQHYFTLRDDPDPAIRDQLAAMIIFDLIIDNADRKGGHVLLEEGAEMVGSAHGAGHSAGSRGPAGRSVRLVDHGVSFHTDRKLRTVAWERVGDPVPPRLRDEVAALADRFAADLAPALTELLTPDEAAATEARLQEVAALERFPAPTSSVPYPWPLL